MLKTKPNENGHMRSMHIMMMLTSYPPIIDSGARLYSELSESLRKMGHSITVISEHPANNSPLEKSHEYFMSRSSRAVSNGEVVLRVSPLSFMSTIPGGKPLRFVLSCFLFAMRGIFTKRPDVILVYSPPLYLGISAYVISKIRGSRFVFNLQDIHPKVLFDSGIIKSPLIKSILSIMEKVCYRKAHSLIAYSDGNRNHIIEIGATGQVFVIPNWSDTSAVPPREKNPSIIIEEIIDKKFVVSYAGTMQQAQGLDVVVEAAESLQEYIDIVFLLAGEGTSKPDLEDLINDKKITNVHLLPVMPKERYIQFLFDSDVCLITLNLDIPLQTVPGKLADIMGYGKPIILVAHLQGDAAKIVKEAKCGFCVIPGDTKAFLTAVLNLYKDERLKNELGRNAKLFAEQHFSRSFCTKRFEQVLYSAVRDDDRYAHRTNF